jgi:SAM-dependent methyltransferase
MNYKRFYEWYHRDRKLPKKIIDRKNFTYRIIISVLDKYCKSNEVLDVGSGVGTIDFYLASKRKKVTGIEISQRAVDVAQKSLKLFGLGKSVKFIRADFLKYSFNNKFDFIICSEVLEHLVDDRKALDKIRKILKSKGIFMLSVPSKNAPLCHFGLIEEFDKRSGHLRRYSLKDILNLMKEFDFKPFYILKSEGIIRNSLYVYSWGNIFIRLANKFQIISDIVTFFDNISLKLLGESQIIVVSKV